MSGFLRQRFRRAQGGSLVWALVGLSACATPQIEQLDDRPRVVFVEGSGPYRWDGEAGWVTPREGAWGPSEQLRVEARRAFDAGFWADSLAGFNVLEVRRRQGQDEWKELSFYIAESYFHLGRYHEALEFYRLVYRKDFPSARQVDDARRRVYEIGLAYLDERMPAEFWGFRYSSPKTGIDILLSPEDGLVTENPHLSYADDALVQVADYYFDSDEYPEAVPLYDRVVAMDASEWKDHAEFRAAQCELLQVRGVDYDEGKLQEAERRFRRYLQNHRRGDHVDEARAKIRDIAEMEGAKNLRIAKFYLRESQPRASEIYLRLVIEEYPNSSAASEAREIRAQLARSRDRW